MPIVQSSKTKPQLPRKAYIEMTSNVKKDWYAVMQDRVNDAADAKKAKQGRDVECANQLHAHVEATEARLDQEELQVEQAKCKVQGLSSMQLNDPIAVEFVDGMWYNGTVSEKNGEMQVQVRWYDGDTPIWLDGTEEWKPHHVLPDGNPLPSGLLWDIYDDVDVNHRAEYYAGKEWTVDKLQSEIRKLSSAGWTVTANGTQKVFLLSAIINAVPWRPKDAHSVRGHQVTPAGATKVLVAWREGASVEWVPIEKVRNGAALLQKHREDSALKESADQAEQFMIESIVDQQFFNHAMQYKAKWSGYEEHEWLQRHDMQGLDEDGHLVSECAVLTSWEADLKTRNCEEHRDKWAIYTDDNNLQVCSTCKDCCKFKPRHV